MSEQITEAKIDGAQRQLAFVMGGNSTFTVRSERTGTRYTFKISYWEEKKQYMVKVLFGQDNENDYLLFGKIIDEQFSLTQKAKNAGVTYHASGYVIAIMWVLRNLFAGVEPKNTEIWHAGRCGRCGRKLTVPESIEIGLGPECATKGF
jgi:Family of unknown function (DUF6011)